MHELLSDGGTEMAEASNPSVRFQPEEWPAQTVVVELARGIIVATTGAPPMGVGAGGDEAWPPSANPSVMGELAAEIEIGGPDETVYCYYYDDSQVALDDVSDLDVVETDVSVGPVTAETDE